MDTTGKGLADFSQATAIDGSHADRTQVLAPTYNKALLVLTHTFTTLTTNLTSYRTTRTSWISWRIISKRVRG